MAQRGFSQLGSVLGLRVEKAKAKRFLQVKGLKILSLFHKTTPNRQLLKQQPLTGPTDQE